MRPLRIGILNVMHDKKATNARFTKVLTHSGRPVVLRYFYPVTHYAPGPVPKAVSDILAPLDIKAAAAMDGFVITGAPTETIPFDEVTYSAELNALLDALVAAGHPQLYLCWGGMVALNHLYHIDKHLLPHKLFGVYPQRELTSSPLLAGLPSHFMAPHARYAEMNLGEIEDHPALTLVATTMHDELFLVENRAAAQTFMFAHLEYGRKGLVHEYEREVAAHPEKTYRRPEQIFTDPATMHGPKFTWQDTQQVFFDNWLTSVAQASKEETKHDKGK